MRSAPSVASSLESESSEGECELLPLCFLFFLSFPTLFSFPSSMAKPPASLPSFSHFATGSSPFLQLALCSFPESLRKSGDQEEEALPQEAGTGSFFFFLSLLSFFFFFF